MVFVAHCPVHHTAELVTQRPWRKHFLKLAEFRHPSSLTRPNEACHWSMSIAIRSTIATKNAESHRKLPVFFLVSLGRPQKSNSIDAYCQRTTSSSNIHTQKTVCFNVPGNMHIVVEISWIFDCNYVVLIWLIVRPSCAPVARLVKTTINIYCSMNKVAYSLGHLHFVGARWGAAAMTMAAHSIYRIINGAEQYLHFINSITTRTHTNTHTMDTK